MATQKPPSRMGRKRWGDLCAFLAKQMKTSGSEKVRMQAALRLADILTVREQREQLELRRELRDAGKAGDAPDGDAQPEGSPETQETAELAAERFLASIRQRTADTEMGAEVDDGQD